MRIHDTCATFEEVPCLWWASWKEVDWGYVCVYGEDGSQKLPENWYCVDLGSMAE